MGREDWNLGLSHKEDQTMPLNYKALGRDDINSNKRKCYIKLIIKHKTNKKICGLRLPHVKSARNLRTYLFQLCTTNNSNVKISPTRPVTLGNFRCNTI